MKKSTASKNITLIILAVASILSIVSFVQALIGGISVNILEGLMGVFFTIIGLLIVWASTPMIEYELKKERIPSYYGLVLILIASLCGVVFIDNLLVVFVFIELSSFMAAGIVMIKDDEENRKSGLKYLFTSIFASVFLLIGIMILYRLTGSFDINIIGNKLYSIQNLTLIKYSFIFIFIAIAFKSALFPLHIWSLDAYITAPTSSSAILSGLIQKSYIILFVKLIYIGYGRNIIESINILPTILILGVCAMIYGSILAIMQRNLKNLIAYSSVAQIGYIFMGIGLGTPLGLIAAIFHIIAHGITKACLFISTGTIIMKTGTKKIEHLSGAGKILPVTIAIFTLGGLSMIGIPLLVGFSSKWNFAQAIMDSGKYWIILILSISSLLNGLYYLPIPIKAYFSIDTSRDRDINLKTSILNELPILILGACVIIFGIFSNPIIDLISQIVENL